MRKLYRCFVPDKYSKYSYLGYVDTLYQKGSAEYWVVKRFIRKVDSLVRPKHIPKFILRIIELIGNDNSIVRVNNRFFHNLSNKLFNNFRITDMKTKWSEHDIRVYVFAGAFNDEIDKMIDKLENDISNLGPSDGKNCNF